MRLEASFRRALTRLLPGLSWHQAVAVVTSVWLIFMAAFALALSQVTGSDSALASAPRVIVRLPGGRTIPRAGRAPEPSTSPAPADDAGADSGDAGSSAAAPDDGLVGSGLLPAVPVASDPLPEDDTTTDPGTGGGDPIEPATWPAGKEAYTVLIGASQKEPEAQGKLDEAIAVGIEAGLLPSLGFVSLVPKWFVIFTGSYDTLADATKASDDLALRGYTDSTAVYLSETRARRCEDGEQPLPTTPAEETPPGETPAPTPTTPAETTPPGTTTPNAPGATVPRADDDPAAGVEQAPALAAIQARCEVRPADDAKEPGDDAQTTTVPTVVP